MNETLNFFSNYKDAFTSIGIFITFIISIVSLYFTVKNNRSVYYVDSVTKNRVEWIDKLRNNLSEFILLSNTQDLTENFLSPKLILENDFKERINKLNLIGTKIKLMLNFSDSFDRLFIEKIDLQILNVNCLYLKTLNNAIESEKNGIEIYTPNSDIYLLQNKIEELNKKIIEDSQIYLKSEWNRVKYESQGKKYDKTTQNFDIEELQKKYHNPDYKNNKLRRFYITSKARINTIIHSFAFYLFMSIFILILIVLKIFS